ncbi:hypothetical protein HY388_00450 [Candidatus Daviesbacteria bacterium]|nr:hypothetical protein [Candidatus Daviesbacteria bacterium]
MQIPLLNQKGHVNQSKGFVPAILLVVLAALGVTGVGTAAASNNSVPGDPLFGLDKAIEEIQVTLAGNDQARARIRLEFAKERLVELETLANTNRLVDPAVTEAQNALNNATTTLSTVETKFKENQIRLESTDLQALLTQLQNLLITHQGLIRKVEIKVKGGEVKAKIKLFEQEASESAEALEDDLDDLEDDGQLNASLARQLKAELKGILVKFGGIFQLTSGGVTYTLTASSGVNLDQFIGKLVELKGIAQNTSPTSITVTKVELEDEVEDEEEELQVEASPKVEAKGFVRSSGSGFVLTFNGGTALYSISSSIINLNTYIDKFVKVEGNLTGNTLNVWEIRVKQTSSGKPVTPALSTAGPSRKKDETKIEEKKEESKKEEEKKSEDKSGSLSKSEDEKEGKSEDKVED